MSDVKVSCSVVEVKQCGCREPNGKHISGGGVVVFVDGVEYGHDHTISGAHELRRTATRWRKSEHGDYLVLR